MTALSIEDLRVAIAGKPILHNVNLLVESGETVAVLGPSGSGKSTLLRAIAGLIPASGSIRLDGEPIDERPPHLRGVGMMFQSHALFPHLNVADNVAFGLRELGWETGRVDRRVNELLETAELSGFGSRTIDALSGGEAQRVALVRALAPQPKLIMLDEPLGSLDRRLRDELAEELHRLLSLTGTTALYVTHDQSEAAVVAERLVVLDQGRVSADGTPAELWSHPPTLELARFLGHRNVSTEYMIPATAVQAVPAEKGTAVVRSSRFVDGDWHLTIVMVRSAGEYGLTQFRSIGSTGIPAGTQVTLRFDANRIHRF